MPGLSGTGPNGADPSGAGIGGVGPPLTESGGAIGAAEFAALMDGIGGFESAPLLVVGVSGGADSMALLGLADEWARARDGRVVAVTFDHALRAESADEAASVAGWMADLGVEHRVERRTGLRPEHAVEEKARRARYDALIGACRTIGALHLLVAHHADDQAETVLLRLCRGSGPDGLAGMAPVRDLGPARLLRPLLGVPGRRLAATCRARGLPWLDDPSNLTDRFARGRLRLMGEVLGREGLDTATLTGVARRCAATRRFMDRALTGFAAEAASVSPFGFVRLDRARMIGAVRDGEGAEGELAIRLLARALAAVGGAEREPRRESVARLWRAIAGPDWTRAGTDAGARRTLGGCLVAPAAADGMPDGILICREHAAALAAAPPSVDGRWDGRFAIEWGAMPGDSRVAALGPGGWRRVEASRRPPDWMVPPAARPSLPALWEPGGVVAVVDFGLGGAVATVSARFEPPNPLVASPFPVVSGADDII